MGLPHSLIESVADGECILFTGAGVNYPPEQDSVFASSYPPEVQPPLGDQLSKTIAEEGDLLRSHADLRGLESQIGNLQRMAALYEISHGRKNLVDLIAREVKTGGRGQRRQPSAVVQALARLPFRLAVTTNYDQLYELALGFHGKREIADIYNPDATFKSNPSMEEPEPDSPRLFKMHGDVDRADSLVITEDDYIQFILRMRDPSPYKVIPSLFEFRLMSWPILFIGYSLADINFRLILKTMRWGVDEAHVAESFAVVGPSVDPVVKVSLRDQQVVFVAKSAWDVVPELYQQVMGEDMPVGREIAR